MSDILVYSKRYSGSEGASRWFLLPGLLNVTSADYFDVISYPNAFIPTISVAGSMKAIVVVGVPNILTWIATV